jgi:hypothetical protein
MGSVQPPAFPAATQAASRGGLSPNQGFYSSTWNGSGDTFNSVGMSSKRKKSSSVKTPPRKFKQVKDFKDFLSSKSKK